MNYKISQRGHAALERNIKCVLLMCFAISFFFHLKFPDRKCIRRNCWIQLLRKKQPEFSNQTITIFKTQFQNQMQTEKPGFRALGKLLYLCLTQSYPLFLFIGFLPAAPASLQTTCFFPQISPGSISTSQSHLNFSNRKSV